MNKVINFDMDGTIADLYGVVDWLPKLQASDATPYLDATPLVRLSRLAYYLNRLQTAGWTINIISWCAKEATPEYDAEVAIAKECWLDRHLPSVAWDNVFICPYDTPKSDFAAGILFDDNDAIRLAWNAQGDNYRAFDETVIFDVLKMLIAGGAL